MSSESYPSGNQIPWNRVPIAYLSASIAGNEIPYEQKGMERNLTKLPG